MLAAGGFAPPKENQSNREAPKKIATDVVKAKSVEDKITKGSTQQEDTPKTESKKKGKKTKGDNKDKGDW
jgi:hypothetical protein